MSSSLRTFSLSLPSASFVAVVGGGPAGLMAAERLLQHGHAVQLFDGMPSVGRKFLLAGKGGMNLTHSEAFADFCARYGAAASWLTPMLRQFGPEAIRAWAAALGSETFVGSSGRVFPRSMKAAPLLRAWVHRLRGQGLALYVRHRWQGWDEAGCLRFSTPSGTWTCQPQAVVLALGGASWPQLGSDGAWQALLQARGVPCAPLLPSNCGFECAWSDYFLGRFAGQFLSTVAAGVGQTTPTTWRRGQFVISAYGVEGSLIYALSAALRSQCAVHGAATLWLDLLPDFDAQHVQQAVCAPRGARSWSSHLRSRLRLDPLKMALLRECAPAADWERPSALAATLKALPVRVQGPRPIAEAISSAGGVTLDAFADGLMLRACPGVFCAGEMLDWDAPTGGYLLSACLASGYQAGEDAARWLAARV